MCKHFEFRRQIIVNHRRQSPTILITNCGSSFIVTERAHGYKYTTPKIMDVLRFRRRRRRRIVPAILI